jgi:hypothetical protein
MKSNIKSPHAGFIQCKVRLKCSPSPRKEAAASQLMFEVVLMMAMRSY